MTTFLESGILSRQLSPSEQKQLEDELNAMIDQSNQTLMREEQQEQEQEQTKSKKQESSGATSGNGDDQGEFDLEALLNSASSEPLVFDKSNNNSINHQELRSVAAAAGISLDDFDMPALKKRKLSMSNNDDSLLHSLLSTIDSHQPSKSQSEPATTIPSPSAEPPVHQEKPKEAPATPVQRIDAQKDTAESAKKIDTITTGAATHTPPASTGVSPAASTTTTSNASNASADTTDTNKSSSIASAVKPVEAPKPAVLSESVSAVPGVPEKKADQPPQPPQKQSHLLSPPSSTQDDGVVAVVSKPAASSSPSSAADVIELKSVAKPEVKKIVSPPRPEINADMIKSIKEQMISRHTLLTTYNTLKSSFTHVCNELKDSKNKVKESERLRQLLANENSSLRAQNQNSLKERDDARLQVRQFEAEINRLKQKAGES